MKVNKYFPFVLIYFFINSVALPFGLTYTALLAPFFYVWIILTRKKEILLPFLAILLPFVLIQLFFVGVDERSFFISFLNIVLVYIFCQAAYTFFKVCENPEKIFRRLLVINFILCLIAIAIYFTPWYNILWIEQEFTKGIYEFRRMRLLTYEPSYYATLFTPVFFFFFLQYLFRQNTIRNGLLLLMIFLPYLLSFSIGVMSCALLAILLTWVFYFSRLTKKRRVLNAIISSGATVGSVLIIIVLYFRHNPVFIRIRNIFSGQDLSGKGRTEDAFILAGKLLDKTNKYWGAGIGQIKIAGEDIIRSYYLYSPQYPVSIPNATAETLALFGWTGLSLRFLIEIFLFFYTKVWNNYYRLLLFLFMFLYQFTGSFITNVAEYVIWILAFTNVFRQFDIKINVEKNSASGSHTG